MRLATSLAIVFLAAGSSWAEEPTTQASNGEPLAVAPVDSAAQPADAPPHFPAPMIGPLLRICAALAALCAAALGLSWWARGRGTTSGVSDTRIRVLASRGLTSKHQLSLVEVAGHRLLIGTGGDSIATLADLTNAEFDRELSEALPSVGATQEPELVGGIGRFEGLDA